MLHSLTRNAKMLTGGQSGFLVYLAMSFFLSSSKLYSVNNKIFSFLKNFVFIVVFTIVYKRKSAVKFQTDTIKKCLSEPTWTQMRAKSKQTKLSPWTVYMCMLTALWGTGANLTFPPPPRSPFLVHCVLGESEITSVLSCISAPTTREKRNFFFSSGNKEQ